MRYGLSLPIFDELADPGVLAQVAAAAEENGWDGVFVWDHVQYRPPVQAAADPWIAVAAQACATETIRLGPLVTPLARRRPQIVARQATTLDHLSHGRMVMGVGLGLDTSGRELSAFGEELDARRRATMLDEALGLLDALWSGEPVDHGGDHYRVEGVRFLPRPVQRPRIPIWVGARWPNRAPLRRAARWDGVCPIDLTGAEQLAELVAAIARERDDMAGYDVAVTGREDSDPAAYAAAGATWWLRDFTADVGRDEAMAVAGAGPPR